MRRISNTPYILSAVLALALSCVEGDETYIGVAEGGGGASGSKSAAGEGGAGAHEAADASAPEAGPAAEVSVTVGYVDPLSAPTRATLELSSFRGAEYCGACHQQHYAEWRTAAHSHSMTDPVYRALVQRQRRDTGAPDGDRFCTQCHSPIGNRSLDILPGFDFEELDPRTLEGVGCETCHRSASVARTHNAGLVLDTSGPLRGPLDDAAAPHETQYLALFDEARLCGSCHDVMAPSGLRLESPFAEWRESPAAREGRPCQSCHMPTYEGTAAMLPNMPVRPNLHRHRFVGMAPSLAADLLEDSVLLEELWAQSEALLSGAASIALRAQLSSGDAGPAQLAITATVENRFGGHDFPTGADFNRQFWLAVEVRDSLGTLIYQTGQLDAAGDLYDDLHPQASEDPDLVLFSARLLDAQGEPTLFTWEASELRRGSLAPEESRDHELVALLPPSAVPPLTIRARVRARAFAPRLLEALGLPDLVPQLRILDVSDDELVVGAD